MISMELDATYIARLEQHFFSLTPQQRAAIFSQYRDLFENPRDTDCYVKMVPGGLLIIRDVNQTRH